jgi:hypothetical protein
MTSFYLSDFIQLMEFDLSELQSFQEQSIEQLKDQIQSLCPATHQQKLALPQIQVEEISVSLPFHSSIKRLPSQQILSRQPIGLAITLPSSLIPASSQNLSRFSITFSVHEVETLYPDPSSYPSH